MGISFEKKKNSIRALNVDSKFAGFLYAFLNSTERQIASTLRSNWKPSA